jgi:hypothetical protein
MHSIDSYLNIPSVHDCMLTGLQIVERTSLNITICDSSSRIRKGNFVFSEVKYCRFNDFRLGNIILDISILTNEDIKSIDKNLCHVLDVDPNELNASWVAALKNDILSGNLLLIAFSTSYGVYGSLLCENVRFEL